jgi:hypothetical protein
LARRYGAKKNAFFRAGPNVAVASSTRELSITAFVAAFDDRFAMDDEAPDGSCLI